MTFKKISKLNQFKTHQFFLYKTVHYIYSMRIKNRNLYFGLILFFILWTSCTFSNQKTDFKLETSNQNPEKNEKKVFPQEETISSIISLPSGFERTNVEVESFAEFLRTLPLKPQGSKVHYFNGQIKEPEDIYIAVVDLDVGVSPHS